MKKLFIIYILCAASLFAQSQTTDNALLFSMQDYKSTARVSAMGGAFGALGANFATLSINPAGLAFYTHNEFSFSTAINSLRSKQTGITSSTYDTNTDVNPFIFSNIGAVIAIPNRKSSSDWKGIVLGFGYNRINSFDKKTKKANFSQQNTLLDYLVEDSNGTISDKISSTAGLFFDADQLYYKSGSTTEYEHSMEGENSHKYNLITETGYQGEFIVSAATNYKRKLFFGITIGIQNIYYTLKDIYKEENQIENFKIIQDYTLTNYTKSKGDGVNAKLGITYKPIKNISLGFAYHSPTSYSMIDTYSSYLNMNAKEEEGVNKEVKNYGQKLEPEEFEYKLKTPSKYIFSGAYIFGQKALLSTDIELIDYSNAKYKNIYDELDMQIDYTNSEISEIYTNVLNIRVGGEYRFNSQISLRGGYAYIPSPYSSKTINKKANRNIITGGIGYRVNNLSINFAYSNTSFTEKSKLYQTSDILEQDYSINDFKLSFGFSF